MHIAVQGTRGDGDEMIILASAPLDDPGVGHKASQDEREDLQVFSFLVAATTAGWIGHPVSVEPGADPPDRVLRHHGEKVGLELTELTIQEMRADLAHARQVGRALQEHLTDHPERFAHLGGRVVALSAIKPDTNKKVPHAVNALADLLIEDRG